jgi:hypothetical protein
MGLHSVLGGQLYLFYFDDVRTSQGTRLWTSYWERFTLSFTLTL